MPSYNCTNIYFIIENYVFFNFLDKSVQFKYLVACSCTSRHIVTTICSYEAHKAIKYRAVPDGNPTINN